MKSFDSLVQEQGGKVKTTKFLEKVSFFSRIKSIKLDYKYLGLILMLTITFMMLGVIIPAIHNTRSFGFLSDSIGSTSTFLGAFILGYALYKAGTNPKNKILITVGLVNILSISVCISVISIASNIEITNGHFYIHNQSSYGGGFIGDNLGALFIKGSYKSLGIIHPSIIFPASLLILTSIFINNYLSKTYLLLNVLVPDESTKRNSKPIVSIPEKTYKPDHKVKPKIIDVLKLHGFTGELVASQVGSSITRHKICLPAGIKTSALSSASVDIARDLNVSSINIDVNGDGDGTINIEIENDVRKFINLKSLLNSKQYLKSSRRSVILGVNAANDKDIIIRDLHDFPHGLIAGTSGGGKSVGLNAMLISLLSKNTPDQLKLILLDPKKVELTPYNSMPHLLMPVETNPSKVTDILLRVISEMEYRYSLMASNSVRSIDELNNKIGKVKVKNPLNDYAFGGDVDHEIQAFNKIPFSITGNKNIDSFVPDIVIIADEFADMMQESGKEIEKQIDRIVAKARAANIIILLATQRPTVNVITGNIKANISTRIAFSVPTSADSITILGRKDAKNLLGKGDCLLMEASGKLIRIQSPNSTSKDVNNFIRTGKL